MGAQMMGAILLALTLVAVAVWLYLRKRSQVGPPSLGAVVYDDAGRTRPEEALVSHKYGLVGKPDYIVQGTTEIFPVEVKSRSCGPAGPYDSEKAQLSAYCLLVEEMTGRTVRFGVIEFCNRQVRIPFGDRERAEIQEVLDEIRRARGVAEVARSHNHAQRCKRCGFRAANICGQALG
jgi:CRISPR/Cas system-associated exonuclease Cas4 (RecB family)